MFLYVIEALSSLGLNTINSINYSQLHKTSKKHINTMHNSMQCNSFIIASKKNILQQNPKCMHSKPFQ